MTAEVSSAERVNIFAMAKQFSDQRRQAREQAEYNARVRQQQQISGKMCRGIKIKRGPLGLRLKCPEFIFIVDETVIET